MKIAFDHQVFTMQRHGGISRYFTKLALELTSLNQEVKIFGGLYQNHYLSDLPDELVSGKAIMKYPKKTGFIINRVNHLLTQHQILNFSPDIIHETYYSVRKPRQSNCPRIITVYDMIHELFPSSFPKNDPYSKLKRKALERADHIISISENTKNDLINLFDISPSKIDVVHLGVDLPEIEKLENPISSKPYLLYVGARNEYKNFDLLIHCCLENPSLLAEYNLVAFGGGEFRPDEKRLISKLGAQSKHIIHKSGGDQELWQLFSHATAFIYPSKYEGFGLPPLEAMSLYCPVISSNTSSMPEVIVDAAEFFNPNDQSDLFRAISNVTSSKNRQEELKSLGKKRIKKLSWGNCAKKTLDIYQNLQR